MKRIGMGILLAAVLLYSCGAFAAGAPSVVTALELYSGDIEEWKETYAGQPVVVRGIATYVGPDQFGLPSVNLSDTAEGETYVLCVLPFSDFFKLGDVAVGQEATFSGELRGRVGDGFILLKNCTIVEN